MRTRGESATRTAADPCELCYQRKGRNAMIVHQLKFEDAEEFRKHLLMLYGSEGQKDGWIESRISFYRFAHQYFGQRARDKYMPLWMAYLEAHGVEIRNRADVIMKHRGMNPNPGPEIH